MTDTAREDLLQRIRDEYRELPGLRLKCAQAQRLWDIDEQTCTELLEYLVEEGFLDRADDDTYTRLQGGNPQVNH